MTRPPLRALCLTAAALGLLNLAGQHEPRRPTSAKTTKTNRARTSKTAAQTLAGAHILITYHGASRAKQSVIRSKAEALRLAQQVAAQAARSPARFAALARKYSDGPSAPRGGDLGSWRRGRMVPAFDQAVIRLKLGQVSGAVETIFGYHVIIRRAPRP